MRNRPQYDLPTAVTFLLAGLGIGSLLTVLLAPRIRPTAGNGLGASGRASE